MLMGSLRQKWFSSFSLTNQPIKEGDFYAWADQCKAVHYDKLESKFKLC
jgi:hypothetical protein